MHDDAPDDTVTDHDRSRRALATLAGVTLLVAGCGGSNPGVANVGTTKTSTSGASGQSSARQSGVLYASCMRAHGVPDFPDAAISVLGGQVEVHVPRSIKGEARLPSASRACQRDLPISSGTPAKRTNIRTDLNFAKCMRSHGISDFPDPMPGGGFHVTGNTNSPQFEAAEKACQPRPASA